MITLSKLADLILGLILPSSGEAGSVLTKKTVSSENITGKDSMEWKVPDKVIIDDEVTEDSTNPVSSKGIQEKLNEYSLNSSLATVATSGDFNDLNNIKIYYNENAAIEANNSSAPHVLGTPVPDTYIKTGSYNLVTNQAVYNALQDLKANITDETGTVYFSKSGGTITAEEVSPIVIDSKATTGGDRHDIKFTLDGSTRTKIGAVISEEGTDYGSLYTVVSNGTNDVDGPTISYDDSLKKAVLKSNDTSEIIADRLSEASYVNNILTIGDSYSFTIDDNTKVPFIGGATNTNPIKGNLYVKDPSSSSYSSHIDVASGSIIKGTKPTTKSTTRVMFDDSTNSFNPLGSTGVTYNTDGSISYKNIVYPTGSSSDITNESASIEVGYDANGKIYTSAPSPLRSSTASRNVNSIVTIGFADAKYVSMPEPDDAVDSWTSNIGNETTPVYIKNGIVTAISTPLADSAYSTTYDKNKVGNLEVPTDGSEDESADSVVTKSAIVNWNGAYNSNNDSNIEYVKEGKLTSIVTKDENYYSTADHNHDDEYVPIHYDETKSAEYAPVVHTHSYAGSDSVGGDATKAVKLKSLSTEDHEIYLDWQRQFSSRVGLRVDSTDMGAILTSQNYSAYASPLNHTHKYAGSDSVGGNATAAYKLTSYRSLKVQLNSDSAASFNGSANAENIGVSGILPVSHGGTGTNNISSIKCSGCSWTCSSSCSGSCMAGCTGCSSCSGSCTSCSSCTGGCSGCSGCGSGCSGGCSGCDSNNCNDSDNC